MRHTIHKPRDPTATSYLMSRVRVADTRMEVRLRSELHRVGLRFRKNVRTLLGKPDVVFARERVAVFVDGDYWHARVFKEGGIRALRRSLKTVNREFWVAKLVRNAKRDTEVVDGLRAAGWKVIRLWESDVKRDSTGAARRVARAVASRRARITFRVTRHSG
jgi:DNA mismatch endonuclease, patch repair protein